MPEKNLANAYPELAGEWHPTKNSREFTPENLTPHCLKKVWWLCGHGHEWQATVNSRSYGTGCPFCANKKVSHDNCLAVVNPELAGEWHPDKNGSLTPEDVTPGSMKKVWWMCSRGHEWQAIINNRNKGTKCPYCTNKKAGKDNCLATVNPDLAKQWHPAKNMPLTPDSITVGSMKKVWWICDQGHEWYSVVYSRKVSNCPVCVHNKGNI